MDYLNFDLEISPGSGGVYPTLVRLPAGSVPGTLRFPFDKQTLELYLSKLEAALLRSRVGRRQALLPHEEQIRDFGTALFDALIGDDLRALYDQQRAKARQQGMGVRIRLLVQAPDLAILPWEYLHDPREADFLCLSSQTPLVRYVKLPQPIEPLKVQPPLGILGMVASPDDQDPLDVEGEKERLNAALQPLEAQGVVKLHWVEGQTWQALQADLWRGPWHVFHFIGHGGFDAKADEGMLALADPQGKTDLLPGSRLGRLLANAGLRLVVLNACEGAKGSDRDLFSSAGASLVRREIPAVVAMQAEISDAAALEFTRTFYQALASGVPVDTALSDARTAIWTKIHNTLEWGTPVLYLRAPDGVLFTQRSAITPPQAQTPTAPAGPARGEPAAPMTRVTQPEVPTPPAKSKEQWGDEGEKHRAARRYQEALECFEQAITLDPKYGPALRGKGLALFNLKRDEEARETLDQAIKALLNLKQDEEALQAADEAIKLDPTPAWAYASKGQMMAALGRHAEALVALQEGLAIAPDDSVARHTLDDLTRHLPVGTLLLTLTGHTGMMYAVAWSADGNRLASGSRDKTVRLWDAATGKPLATLTGHTGSVGKVTWSPDGRRLASARGAFDGPGEDTVRLWDADTGKLLATLTGHTSSLSAVAWSPDGRYLASASADGTVRLWDAASGAPLTTLKGHKAFVNAVAWSPDSHQLASASGSSVGAGENTVRLWEAATGKCLATLKGHKSAVHVVAWSPDGRRLASASGRRGDGEHTARLWDAATGKPLAILTGHTSPVNAVAWSPDGRRLASASGHNFGGDSDDTVRLWEAVSGKCLAILTGHTSPVDAVAWSPDGRRLATGSWDRTARLWDVATGALLATLKGHKAFVDAVAWSPDGRRLASVSTESLRVWWVGEG